MKRNFLMKAFVCLFTVVALCSCSKDDDEENGNTQIPYNTFIAVENGASYNGKIDVVKVDINNDHIFYSTQYENGGFKLELPEKVSDPDYFYNPTNILLDDCSGDVVISNPNVNIFYAYLKAYRLNDKVYGGEEYVGSFHHGTEKEEKKWYGYSDGDLVYSDSECNIIGTCSTITNYPYIGYTYTYNYNVHLKEGWNMEYWKETRKENESIIEITTQVPAGAKWYLDKLNNDLDDDYIPPPIVGTYEGTMTIEGEGEIPNVSINIALDGRIILLTIPTDVIPPINSSTIMPATITASCPVTIDGDKYSFTGYTSIPLETREIQIRIENSSITKAGKAEIEFDLTLGTSTLNYIFKGEKR
jgi:hypothetical protein